MESKDIGMLLALIGGLAITIAWMCGVACEFFPRLRMVFTPIREGLKAATAIMVGLLILAACFLVMMLLGSTLPPVDSTTMVVLLLISIGFGVWKRTENRQ
jgi:hypothetical protein